MTTTILVIDDDAGVRALLKRWLDATGHPLREAATGEDALDLIKADSSIRLALCDVAMPGQGGLWLVQQIRDQAPHVAVVLATADDHLSPTVTLGPGVVAYVVKPFERAAVLHAVQAGLKWSNQHAAPADRTDPLERWLNPPGKRQTER
jgi:two-component system OmpR family response regulator